MIHQATRSRHLLPALALTVLFPVVARATSFSWISPSGQFNAASNWTQSGLPVDADGIPDANDTATFDRGNVTLYPVYFGNLLVPNSDIHPTVDRVVIGNNPLNFVGLYGSTLTVDSGNITETARGVVIGSDAGDVAALTSTLAAFDTQYATLGSAAGSSGTLNLSSATAGAFSVSGTGATYDLIVGLNGTGTINVSNGRNVTVADDMILGMNATGVGNVSISGAGSTLIGTGDFSVDYSVLTVGGAGAGTLDVLSGGVVDLARLYIGNNAGSMGTVTVDSRTFHSATANISGLWVGSAGNGTLDVIGGGQLNSFAAHIGEKPNSVGHVRIRGGGATWTNGDYISGVSEINVGEAGHGMVDVTNDGHVVQDFHTFIGRSAGSMGEVTVDGADSMWTNEGELYVGSAGAGTLSITNGGKFLVGSDAFIGRNSDSTGDVTVDGAGSQLLLQPLSYPLPGHDLRVGTHGSGTLTVSNGAQVRADTLWVDRVGALRGNGLVLADVQSGGDVSPGAPVGTLIITGNYTQMAAGDLLIDLSATSADKLVVSGDITLSGTLAVSLVGGYVPHSPRSFDVLDWFGSRSETFVFLELPTLGGLLAWNTSQLYTFGVLTVSPVLPGDYNDNGIVDAADYVLWRKTLGQIGAGLVADGNGNGSIDSGDYGVWRAYFGQTAGSGNGATTNVSVPEPTSIVLLTFAAAVLTSRRRLCARQVPKLIGG